MQKFTHDCRKKPYGSRKEAEASLVKIMTEPAKHHNYEPRFVYKCETCKQWHLTSMDQVQYYAVKTQKEKRESKINPSQEDVLKRIEFLKEVPKYRNKFKKR